MRLALLLSAAAACACGGDVLPADPGLEGGKNGHWGVRNDKDWIDARWNAMDTGPALHYALRLSDKAGDVVAKSVTVKLSGNPPVSVCYDTSTMTPRLTWRGGAKFDGARYGLINWPSASGDVVARNDLPAWESGKVRYRGLRVTGKRVTFEYEVDGVAVRETPFLATAGLVRTIEVGPREREIRFRVSDRAEPTVFGPSKERTLSTLGAVVTAQDLREPTPLNSRWGEPLVTRGTLGTDKGAFVIDTLTVPYKNAFNALFFISGLDFFENGDAAVCTLHGDVWIVRGIGENLDKLTWQRFATGLFQPMGVKIVGGKVHVMCRDRLLRLHDLNADGEADFFESVCDACVTSTNGHDYSTGLETDRAGNFYHVDPLGLHRISPDGATYETLATGWRNPVSLAVGPHDELTVSPQEGEWTPGSMVCEVKPGGFYGYHGPQVTPARPLGYDPPLCYIPRLTDNSTGGHVWISNEKWGALNGQLLNLSFGRCSAQLILRENAGELLNGAVVPLPWRFLSGAFRGRFRAQDGHLYVAGTFGWVTTAARDGCLQRVRYNGAALHLPVAMQTRPDGLALTFSEPLKREAAEDTDSYALEAWNYKYGAQYGSSDYSPSKPETVGHDPIELRSARLSPDGRTVTLQFPLRAVMQLRVKYSLSAADGSSLRNELTATINRVPDGK